MMKKVTILLLAVFALGFTYAQRSVVLDGTSDPIEKPAFNMKSVIFEESFEYYDDFAIDLTPWITIQQTSGITWDSSDFDFLNEGTEFAFMAFNPYETDPAINDDHPAVSGKKYAVAIQYQDVNDNKWLISPEITPDATSHLMFYTKSITDAYGLERFKVLVNTTGSTDPADFTQINAGDYLESPVTWTAWDFDLSSYDGQTIRFAINYVSEDAFIFMLDDIVVGTPSDNYFVTFNVDMNAAEGFDPATHEVYISGSDEGETAGFNGDYAVWPQPGTEPAFQLTDPDEDGIYSLTLENIADGNYIYKFFYIEPGTPSWDNGEWAGGDNRAFTVAGNNVVLTAVWGGIGLGVNQLAAEIDVYPNPSNGVFNINTTENVSLEVLDITGKRIQSMQITGNTQVELNNAGMYFFRFSNENGSAVRKVIVK